ncbi:hypothetical protein TNCT_401111 [Trichonephila clavata]|uniref:Uncharacterized protein n=1 Tax=Trichonephila clavata TaxID=2740835 RepID=A0A8X6I1T1_TRICU|nr:hypothetical protein TNCT_401111 [Trichonephila clavata]
MSHCKGNPIHKSGDLSTIISQKRWRCCQDYGIEDVSKRNDCFSQRKKLFVLTGRLRSISKDEFVIEDPFM